ncbi:MAG: hypothetical protein OXM00_10110 [Paracoccaceae bacterium]|nr:hypothetical protein [Candidatus Poribacteria bacterium]MDE2917564.1 hypothetical protein [Paracoccaceae bacterium]
MITVTVKDETHDVVAIPRPPLIYLDHWALRCLSSNGSFREKFIEFFKKYGTFLFSWTNVLEVAENSGTSLDAIQSFLTEIGEQWFPIEWNAFEVIRREKEFTLGNNNPCLASGFLEAYYPHISDGPLSLSTVCDLTQDSEIKPACCQHLEYVKAETRKTLIYWRSEDPKSVDIPKYFDPDSPTIYVVERLRYLIQKESFKIEANDALDFLHAVVPIAYGDFVLLDKHWADLARKLKLPSDRVKVYSPKHVEKFLENLERVERSGWTMN